MEDLLELDLIDAAEGAAKQGDLYTNWKDSEARKFVAGTGVEKEEESPEG